MYNNVGHKIKFFATVLLILNIIIFFAAAIWSCSLLNSMFRLNFGGLIFIFLAIVGIGAVISWVISLFVYGYGVIVENSEIQAQISQYTYEEDQESENYNDGENT